MPSQKAFPDNALSWNPASTLPSDHLVLTRIESILDSMPPRLVFARADNGQILVGAGGYLSDAWSVTGWLDTDVEIELFDAAALSAQPRPLEWKKIDDDNEISEDGFGGHYVIEKNRKRQRLLHQIDVSQIIFAPSGADLHKTAQQHFNTRIRRNLKASSKQKTS